MKKTSGRLRVVADLRGRIETGTLAPGSRLPGERDLAAEFSISRATVRAAIEELVYEGLLEQRPRCRPTVPFHRSKRPSSARSEGHITVWMREDVDDIGFTLILKGIRKVLGQSGRHFAVGYPAASDPEGVRAFSESLQRDEKLEGVILWASDDPLDLPAYRSLMAAGKSLVCIDRDPPGPLNADVVAVDHFRGARASVEHLIALGHRRIGMVGNDDRVSSVRDRRDGYFSALRDAGISWDEDLLSEVAFIHPTGSESLKRSVDGVIERYLALPSPPTALFAVNDQVAMHLQDALMGRGLSVPGDMSLVGFDWFLRWLPSGGDLTTVAQPFEKIGELAAKRLLERIQGNEPLDSRHILLPAPLVVKATTRELVPSGDHRTAPSP